MNRSYPEEAAGGAIRFHGFKNLAEEHLNLYPSRELIQQGYLSIAKDPDGSQYCYHLDEGAIYHLDDCGPTAAETSKQALACWTSFKDFLEWLIDDP